MKSLRIATFNLYQYAAPPYSWYEKENCFRKKDWRYKNKWITNQLKRLDADIVGFQEVFSVNELEALLKTAGYPYFAVVDTARTDPENASVFIAPVVAIASRLPISAVSSVGIEEDILQQLNLPKDFSFSRTPIQARVQTPLGEITVYVSHLKSKRPLAEPPVFENNENDSIKMLRTVQANSLGNVASLVKRAAEAALLYHTISELTINDHHLHELAPQIVLGDLNDDEDSIVLESLVNAKRPFEIDGKDFDHLHEDFRKLWYDYRLYNSAQVLFKNDAENETKVKREKLTPTYYFRGRGIVLDYILVSNLFNSRNPAHMATISNHTVLDDHLKKDNVSNIRQSDHAQVVVQIDVKNTA